MIWHSLELRNFGPYRHEVISLEGVSLAGVTGPNGAGKSMAFIDAIFWILFDDARGTADELLSDHGAEDMMGELIFEMPNHTWYRVCRKRSFRTKTGKSEFSLSYRNTLDNWIPIAVGAEPTKKELDALLRVDSHTLACSAFFLQGEADRFTKSTPATRLNVFANILNVSHYPQLKKQANKEILRLTPLVTLKTEELQQVRQIQTTLATLTAEYTNVQTQTDDTTAALNVLDTTYTAGVQEQARITSTLEHLKQLQPQLKTLQTKQTQTTQRRKALHAKRIKIQQVLNHAPVIHQAVTHAEALQIQLQTVNQQLLELDERRSALDAQLTTIQSNLLETQQRRHALEYNCLTQAQLQQDLARVSQDAQRRETLCTKREQLTQLLEAAPMVRHAVIDTQAFQTQLHELDTKIQELDTRRTTLDEQLASIQASLLKAQQLRHAIEKNHLAQSQVRQEFDRDRQTLTESLHRDQATAAPLKQVPCTPALQQRCQFTRLAVEAQHRIAAAQATLAARPVTPPTLTTLQDEATSLEAQLATYDAADLPNQQQTLLAERVNHEAHRRSLQLTRTAIEVQCREAEQRAATLPELERAEADLASLDADLQTLDLAIESSTVDSPELTALRETAATLQAQILADEAADLPRQQQALLQQRTELDTTRRSLQTTRTSLETHRRIAEQTASRLSELQQAEADRLTVDADLQTLDFELATLTQDAETIQAQLAEFPTYQATATAIANQLTTIETDRITLRHTLAMLAEERGRLITHLHQAEQAAATIPSLDDELHSLQQDLRHFEILHEAYERIPILILENALPVLEQTTNDVLQKISSGGYRVRFATQKEVKKTKSMADTLEIIIHMPFGERRYELFSGGQKFRIDLAIRIGLAKLLTLRSGATIQTVVIDEGLGSLDAEGISQLRVCLDDLQHDFKRVIVITHVDKLKGTFPVEFQVTVDDQGISHIQRSDEQTGSSDDFQRILGQIEMPQSTSVLT